MKRILILLLFLYQAGAAQNGKVGINTNNPVASLHVLDGDVVFTGTVNASTPADLPGTGTGVRLLWYPDKAAFRTGFFEAPQWNKDSIGYYSFAAGYNSMATHSGSTSIGYRSKAYNTNTVAMGSDCIARGVSSVAIGMGSSTANGALYSLSLGTFNITEGEYSTAIGNLNFTTGSYSSAFGYSNSSSGIGASAFGKNNANSGSSSLTLGQFCTASGNFSFAAGYSTVASNTNSVALGTSNQASGENSSAFGASSKAVGKYAVTLGYSVKANGYSTFATGMYNDSIVAAQTTPTSATPLFIVGNGDSPAALSNALVVRKDGNVGIGNVNPQYGLHVVNSNDNDGGWAEGIVVENLSVPASAGEAAISFRNAALAPGKQWTTGVDQTLAGLSFNYGASLSPGNTRMFLDTFGNIGIGTTSPQFRMHIVNNNTFDGGWEDGLVIENTSVYANAGEAAVSFRNAALSSGRYWMTGINQQNAGYAINYGTAFQPGSFTMFIDTSGQVGIGTAVPGFDLEVNGTAGKPGGGAWTATSDARLKQDIHPYTDGLSTILQIEPVRYHYNALSGYDTQPEYVGVIAQDLQKIAPYMVAVSSKKMSDGSSGYLEVDNSAMTYMLINAVKEQQAEIDVLEKEFDLLISSLSQGDEKKK